MKTFAYNDWIPRVKHGAGLLEFTPAKAGAGMTTKLKDPAGDWLHFLHKDSKEKQEMNKYSEFRNPQSAFRIRGSAIQESLEPNDVKDCGETRIGCSLSPHLPITLT